MIVVYHAIDLFFSLDDFNTEDSDASTIPELSFDILAQIDSPTPFICITDDNDVTHTPDSRGTPIHFVVRIYCNFNEVKRILISG